MSRASGTDEDYASENVQALKAAMEHLKAISSTDRADISAPCEQILADYKGALIGTRRDVYSALIALQHAVATRIDNSQVRSVADALLAAALNEMRLEGRFESGSRNSFHV